MARRVSVGIVLMAGVFLGTGNGALSEEMAAGSADAAVSAPSAIRPATASVPPAGTAPIAAAE